MYRLVYLLTDLENFFIKIFAFILLYLSPISNYVHLVLILIGLDLISGSYASIKEGQKFTARKLRCTIEKFVFYAIAIIVAYILQQIISEGTELARIVALYIGATETKSIYENISRITHTDLVEIAWGVIKEKLDDWIDSVKKKNSNPKI